LICFLVSAYTHTPYWTIRDWAVVFVVRTDYRLPVASACSHAHAQALWILYFIPHTELGFGYTVKCTRVKYSCLPGITTLLSPLK
jgi:hypothetical protein